MRLLSALALLLLWGCSGSTVEQATRPLADAAFAHLCADTGGVTLTAPAIAGGVNSDNPNLGSNLWLLFDAGADFVEFRRRAYAGEDSALVAEWGTVPTGAAIWRVERKPAGHPACATFERWLERVSHTRFNYDAVPARWLNRSSYGNQCLSVRLRPATAGVQSNADGYSVPIYDLREDGAPLGQVGSPCFQGSERRTILTLNGQRILEVRTYRMSESNRCEIAYAPRFTVLASCGDPNESDLFMGRRVFYANTLDGRLRWAGEGERCGEAGRCWRERPAVVRYSPSP